MQSLSDFGVIFQLCTPKSSFVRLVAQQQLNIFFQVNNETFINSLDLKLFLIVQEPNTFSSRSQNHFCQHLSLAVGNYNFYLFQSLKRSSKVESRLQLCILHQKEILCCCGVTC